MLTNPQDSNTFYGMQNGFNSDRDLNITTVEMEYYNTNGKQNSIMSI